MKVSIILGFLPIFFLVLSIIQKPALAVQKSYIVYLGSAAENGLLSADPMTVTNNHLQFLSSFLQRHVEADDIILYSYNKIFDGFSALLHEEEAIELENHPDVISVFKNELKTIDTTRSWGFLGLDNNGVIPDNSIWKKANFGQDVIIANLDTGVWPESKSFADDNMGPIPAKFKGACENEFDPSFKCNRKLIGARYFYKGYEQVLREANTVFNATKTPRDMEGHGSHTLSTAGGNAVPGASIGGFGNGTAVGGSPRARVATYKVCWPATSTQAGGCSDSDILAALEAAVNDDVDVISLSIGSGPAYYLNDSIAIGAFHAVKNGIPVVASAGNSGPEEGVVSNVSPWLLTVAASSTDREFVSNITLGNNIFLKGASLARTSIQQPAKALITGVDARYPTAPVTQASYCTNGTVDPAKAKGKILVCLRGLGLRKDKGLEAARVGAVWLILANDKDNGLQVIADDYAVPASHLSFSSGEQLFAYMNSTKNPVATITAADTELGQKPAPFIAQFSSRGPNRITPGILKPDITAPGIRIIAAFSEAEELGIKKAPYAILDGTSMSCPHVTGVVGLIKSVHRNWSPSAIKSAIMTTAYIQDNRRKAIVDFTDTPATPFHYGAGHVRPNRAVDPGLVYDMDHNDYLNFLCAVGYNQETIKKFSQHSYHCPASVSIANLNYPTITITDFTGNATVVRRLKNVAQPGTYLARLRPPVGVSIAVEPKTLIFTKLGQELEYRLTLTGDVRRLPKDYSFGQIVWSDGKHVVRSSISVTAKSNVDRALQPQARKPLV